MSIHWLFWKKRAPWQFRNQTVLKRSDGNVLAKRTLTVGQMKEDFEILKKALVAIHPGIYRYQTPESLGRVFNEFNAKLKTLLSEKDFFVFVSQFTNRLDCGHTYQNPYNQDTVFLSWFVIFPLRAMRSRPAFSLPVSQGQLSIFTRSLLMDYGNKRR